MPAATKARSRKKADSPADVMRRGFDALAARDAEAASAVWADDAVYEFVPVGIYRGKAEIRAYFDELFAAVPDFELHLQNMAADGARVFAEWRAEGTFTGGRFLGIEPTGRRIQLRGVDSAEVEGGTVVRNTIYYDGMTFARQVGMMPPADSGAERAMTGAFNAFTKARAAIQERLDR